MGLVFEDNFAFEFTSDSFFFEIPKSVFFGLRREVDMFESIFETRVPMHIFYGTIKNLKHGNSSASASKFFVSFVIFSFIFPVRGALIRAVLKRNDNDEWGLLKPYLLNRGLLTHRLIEHTVLEKPRPASSYFENSKVLQKVPLYAFVRNLFFDVTPLNVVFYFKLKRCDKLRKFGIDCIEKRDELERRTEQFFEYLRYASTVL